MYDVIIRSCPDLKIMFLDTPSPEWVDTIIQNPRIPSNLTKLKMNKVNLFYDKIITAIKRNKVIYILRCLNQR